MKNLHFTMKTLLTLCVLVCFFSACRQNDDIPSPPEPPVKPDWLLSKVFYAGAGASFEDTFYYNSFYKPYLRETRSYTFGKITDVRIDTFIYNSQQQLIKAQAVKSGTGITLLDYDQQGRLVKMTASQNGQNSEAHYTYRGDTMVEGIAFDGTDTSRFTQIYNKEGNVVGGTIFNAIGVIAILESAEYDNSPNVERTTNLSINALSPGSLAGGSALWFSDPVLSTNNLIKRKSTVIFEGDTTSGTDQYHLTYNAQGLVILGGPQGEISYEYIKPKP